MLNVGLTGNIAAGKSTVSEHFRRWGAFLIDSDLLVREVQSPGSPVLTAIANRFGPGMIAADGRLDRDKLRQAVFGDADALASLNAIVHPAVQRRRTEMAAEARAAGATVVVNDIPLLFEVLDPASFDAVVLVDAPTAVRRARLVGTRGISPEEADRLIAAQMPSAQKREKSDFVIDNDGGREELEKHTLDVWNQLIERAG